MGCLIYLWVICLLLNSRIHAGYVEMEREYSGRVKDIHSNFKYGGGFKSHRLPDA